MFIVVGVASGHTGSHNGLFIQITRERSPLLGTIDALLPVLLQLSPSHSPHPTLSFSLALDINQRAKNPLAKGCAISGALHGCAVYGHS